MGRKHYKFSYDNVRTTTRFRKMTLRFSKMTSLCFCWQIQAMKMMVRWLLGIRSNQGNSATSTLRLLHTMIQHEGDLMERGNIKLVLQLKVNYNQGFHASWKFGKYLGI